MRSLRCSSLPMFLKCSHSQDQSELLIEAYNGAADLGTAAHDAMRSVINEQPVDVALFARRHGVEEKELGPLVWYGRQVWEQLRDAFPLPDTEIETELFVKGFRLTGHIDVLSQIGRIAARFLDWKTGRKEDADYRAQIAGYATTLILRYDLNEAIGSVAWLRSQSLETYVFTRADALAFVERISAALNPGARYRHGEHCAYCPRSHNCEALVAIGRRDAAIFSQAAVEQTVATAPPSEVVSMRRQTKVIEAFIKSFDEAVKRRVAKEGPLPSGDGYELALEEEAGKRIIQTLKAWPLLQEHLTDEELASCVKVSASAVDSIVAKKAGKGKGAAAKRALAAELEAAGAVSREAETKLRERRVAPEETPDE
jgi:hypothetical protein